MPRILSPQMTERRLRRRAQAVPILSTLAASLLAVLPVVATAPLMPPVGLMMLLAWRLLRPELWPVWMGLPLGLFDDLASGQPPGTGPLIWTLVMIGLDVADRWIVWRGWLFDWTIATGATAAALAAGWLIALATGGGGPILQVVPQLALSILLFPLVQRVCARLDRFRLLA